MPDAHATKGPSISSLLGGGRLCKLLWLNLQSQMFASTCAVAVIRSASHRSSAAVECASSYVAVDTPGANAAGWDTHKRQPGNADWPAANTPERCSRCQANCECDGKAASTFDGFAPRPDIATKFKHSNQSPLRFVCGDCCSQRVASRWRQGGNANVYARCSQSSNIAK